MTICPHLTVAACDCPTKDFTTALFYAISGIGYGKGFTPAEATDNYITTQRRNFKHLKASELPAPTVFRAPEGTVGFVLDHQGVMWEDAEGNYSRADQSHLLDVR